MDQIVGISRGFPAITSAFQPIVDRSGISVAHEALVRGLNNDCACMVLSQVADWDLETFDYLCRKTAIDNAIKQGFTGTLSLNFLPRVLGGPFTIQRSLQDALDAGLPPPIFELLEHEPIRCCATEANLAFAQVRKAGSKVYIDDYGTAHNSHMSLLADLNIDGVKLSLEVVRNICRQPRWKTLMTEFIRMAHTQQIVIVAEGIENETERETLESIGADLFQGYHIARPTLVIGHQTASTPFGDISVIPRCACG